MTVQLIVRTIHNTYDTTTVTNNSQAVMTYNMIAVGVIQYSETM